MTERIAACLEKLPAYLGGHLLLSLAALAVGLGISLPLGIAMSRRRKLAELTLGIAGAIQTIPSLALLALMVPLLGGMIGFLPAFIALTLYSILPILANTVIGIKGVDPTLTEAARGLGMNDRQLLFRVQLPLASPVILSGIRTATVLVVGTATLVTPVGGKSLGNYIFSGLNTGNKVSTVFGCVAAALLAVVLDQLIHLLEVAAQRRSHRMARLAGLGLLVVLGGGLAAPAAQLFRPTPEEVVIGNLEFTEQHILGELLAQHLKEAGFATETNAGLGETIQFDALCHNHVDCCVEYTGNIWARVMQRTDLIEPDPLLQNITAYLAQEHGVVCLGRLGFQNAYILAMPEELAESLNIRTISDLTPHATKWVVVGDTQVFEPRPDWTAVKRAYDLKFADEIGMSTDVMYKPIGKGKTQVIVAYSTDGRLTDMNLRILRDDKKAFPNYDAVLLLSPRAAGRPNLVNALTPLLGKIDLPTMQQANKQVDVNKMTPAAAATKLLQTISPEE